MAASDPIIGKKLGDYIIVDMLGQGGMARVYRGLDKKLNRYAAVKVIDAQPVGEDQEEYRTRFQNEARAIARLNHPHIVGIYQFDQVGTLYYMAMSFIEGKDLRGVIKNHAKAGTRLTHDEILNVIRDIGDALDYAHSEGVVHRDIKPSNIMVTPAGKSILTDFGLALSVPEGTVGNTFGSAHYIAPEQAISSANAVPQSDIYSLGVVLFEMLTNNLPFNDPSALAVAMKHLSDAPPPPSTVASGITPEVDAVVMRALDKDPKKRYPNGAAMTQALRAAFGMEPPKAAWSESGNTATQKPAVRPPLPNPLDDSPTVTDSRASAQTRHEMFKRIEAAQPAARRQRTLMMAGAVVLVLLLIGVGAVLLGGNKGEAVTPTAPPTVTEKPVAALPSATSAPLVEATAEATAETVASPTQKPTTAPTEKPTDAPTTAPTEKPTDAPTTAPTEKPTDAPTTAPTDAPTTAPTDIPTLEATIATVATDTPVLLVWDEQSLTLLNRSSGKVDVSGIVFVQTQADGKTLVFDTQSWSNGSRPLNGLTAGDCFQVQRNDINDVDPPAVCTRRHAWSRVSFPRWFWLSDDPAATFEVRRGDEVLATCTLSANECALPLP